MGFKELILEEELSKKSFQMLIESSKMNGQEIADKLGISKQAVSGYLKKAIAKVYDETRKLEKSWSPFEVCVAMSIMFNVEEDDINNFFKLFPKDIKNEIEEDARKVMPSLKN
jgi:predicted transcriptional regulator